MESRKFMPAALLMLALGGITRAQQQPNFGREFLRISPAVAMGLIKHRVEPGYPENARARHVEGKVVVRYLIDKEGNTKGVFAVEGDPLLRDAAVAAVQQWKFKPYLLNREPVQVATRAILEFKLKPPVDRGHSRRLRISQGVAKRNIIKKVNPAYPAEARAHRIQGDVILSGTIDREGNLIDVKPISGHPLLVEAAVQAVKQWKYKPYTLNGKPVEVETQIKISFRL